MRIGFIGLGSMGSGMAASLVKAGHEVTVYNRTVAKMKAITDLGANAAASIGEACRGDFVITMVTDDDAVESIAFSSGGIIDTLGKGAIHISMSTISTAISDRLTHAHLDGGQSFIAAPVFGRPDAAASGRLFVVAGGLPEDVSRCMPIFDALGQRTFHISDKPSDAHLVKLGGNFIIASLIETLGEVMALIDKAGISKLQFLDLLTSTLFNAPAYKIYGGLIAEKKFEPAGFTAPLGLKDIRLALAAAENLRVPMPLASLLRDRFLRLLASGGESLDWSAIALLAAEDAGQARR